MLARRKQLSLWAARRQIEAFDSATFENPLLEIGMPDIGLRPRLTSQNAELELQHGRREVVLARRVSDEERRQHFEAFARIASDHDIELIVIHPSYRHSRSHRCLLTALAAELELNLIEAHPLLHPENQEPLFLDFWHPNSEGHARLANALAAKIRELRLDPGN